MAEHKGVTIQLTEKQRQAVSRATGEQHTEIRLEKSPLESKMAPRTLVKKVPMSGKAAARGGLATKSALSGKAAARGGLATKSALSGKAAARGGLATKSALSGKAAARGKNLT